MPEPGGKSLIRLEASWELTVVSDSGCLGACDVARRSQVGPAGNVERVRQGRTVVRAALSHERDQSGARRRRGASQFTREQAVHKGLGG